MSEFVNTMTTTAACAKACSQFAGVENEMGDWTILNSEMTARLKTNSKQVQRSHSEEPSKPKLAATWIHTNQGPETDRRI